MNDSEKLDLMLEKMQSMENHMTNMEDRMTGMEDRMTGMEDRMTGIEDRMTGMEDRMTVIEGRMTKLEVTLENKTNRNIQLLAENHINLVDKLNQAIRVSDKGILYEVQVSGLNERVDRLELEVAEIRSKIA